MGIAGASLVALGVICICCPMGTVLSLAWLIGIITLVCGFATLLNWGSLRNFFPGSGSILLSAILQIVFGIIFLRNDLAMAGILPLVFAFLILFEGINISVRSFDYRMVGFRGWWVNLLLGVTAAVLGVLCLCIPGLGGPALSICIGLGLILAGMVYFIALTAVNRFEKRLRKNPWIDEQ